jgi:type IV secretion system protein TrbI
MTDSNPPILPQQLPEPPEESSRLSWWFIGFLASIAIIFIVSVITILLWHSSSSSSKQGPPVQGANAEGEKIASYSPPPLEASSPAPTPPPQPQPYPSISAPVTNQVNQAPATEAQVSEAGRARQQALQKALDSNEIAMNVDRTGHNQSGSTLETPQLINTGKNQTDDQGNAPMKVSVTAAPPHTVLAWTYIYAELQTPIQSDHPGDVLAVVSMDIKDSVNQSEVLIPHKSILHGWHEGRANIQQGDRSIEVAWDDIEFPNGGHVHLPKFPGMNEEGYPGIDGTVDNHYMRTWGPALLISAITAGGMLAQHPTYGGLNGYDATQQATGAFSQSLTSRATGQLEASADSNKPTITVESGKKIRVEVTHDMTFDHAWQVDG